MTDLFQRHISSLTALATYLLENDIDMKLPDAVDIDPAETAELLTLLALGPVNDDLLNKRPLLTDPRYGHEPSLREMVRLYYKHYNVDDPEASTARYFETMAFGECAPLDDDQVSKIARIIEPGIWDEDGAFYQSSDFENRRDAATLKAREIARAVQPDDPTSDESPLAHAARSIASWAGDKVAVYNAAKRHLATSPLRATGIFLLNRLDDFHDRIVDDEDAREWHGHVTSAIARFRDAMNEAQAEVRPLETTQINGVNVHISPAPELPPIDWTKPLEAEDGTPFVLCKHGMVLGDLTNPDIDGDYWVTIEGEDETSFNTYCVGPNEKWINNHYGKIRNRPE
jgi:hypothetical protein